MSSEISAETLANLAKYDTPTVCNVIELFDVRPRNHGYMNHSIKASFPEMPPMVGFALTSSFRSQQPPRGGDVYTAMVRQVEMFSERVRSSHSMENRGKEAACANLAI
ncbi:MAG: hypothetical protein O3A00_18185, partial [Planctomycetota bacterium]|nr:hypothetical protein [Planctomycetota bacterium]